MAAYLIGHITVKDPVQWKIYTDVVARSPAPFWAEIIFGGKRTTVLCGYSFLQPCCRHQIPRSTYPATMVRFKEPTRSLIPYL